MRAHIDRTKQFHLDVIESDFTEPEGVMLRLPPPCATAQSKAAIRGTSASGHNAPCPLLNSGIRGPSDHAERQAERVSGLGSDIRHAERLRWAQTGHNHSFGPHWRQ